MIVGKKHGSAPPPVTSVYLLQQKMISVGEDYWIENGLGQRAYHVNGKLFHLRKTFVLEDADGTELLRIQSRLLRVRETMVIERGGETVATLHKHLVGLRDRYTVDLGEAGELHARGNFLDHEYVIRRDDTEIAEVSKRWMRVRDTYGVSVLADEDIPLLLAVVVCIDSLSHQGR
jgi:uncharacterized protein YxjI